MLAFLDEGRQREVMAAARNAKRADGAPVDPTALSTELTLIRKRGFATSRGERVPGAASVAAPILGRRGEVIGCMSVAGVTIRQDEAALESLGPIVLAEATALSRELGWSGDRPTHVR
jgi:DNA-binding IclR family transcriptional regulator